MKRVFIYTDIRFNTNLVLIGKEDSSSDDVLDNYIKWHNYDFCEFDKSIEKIECSYFKFEYSALPIDFSEN